MKTKRRVPTNMVLTASAVPSKEIAILNGKQGLEILRRKCMYVSPKSGDTTRCVNVVDNHGFSPVRMDNQQRFVDKTMI
jgi:hypothetical protein